MEEGTPFSHHSHYIACHQLGQHGHGGGVQKVDFSKLAGEREGEFTVACRIIFSRLILYDQLQLVQTPAAISSHTIKIYRSITKPYITLAGAFESGDFSRLEAEVDIARPIWHMVGL